MSHRSIVLVVCLGLTLLVASCSRTHIAPNAPEPEPESVRDSLGLLVASHEIRSGSELLWSARTNEALLVDPS